jgi:thiol-disulfide isomerase/thioredoxin
MRRIIFLAFACLLFLGGCKTSGPATQGRQARSQDQETASLPSVDYTAQTTWLLGYFNPVLLKREPYSVWFYRGYDEYQPGQDAINDLRAFNKDDISIKIVMGTWCPDSRREVPRFMKILDTWQFPSDRVIYIGVDNEKLSPVGEYEGLDIHRVPTFIIYKNNIEAGRIIENPVTSLEQDMVNILRGMNNNK